MAMPDAVTALLQLAAAPAECLSRSIYNVCLLYTSDAADERSSVDLGGRRIIKTKKKSARSVHSTYERKMIPLHVTTLYTQHSLQEQHS